MTPQDLVAAIAFAWLMGAGLWMVLTVRQGRSLADELALRHPGTYEEMGRPRPGYFQTGRRDRWFRFIMQREFLRIDDPVFVARCEAHRGGEIRALIAVISSLFGAGAIVLWLQWAP